MSKPEIYIENTPAAAIELLRPHVEAPGSRMSYLLDDQQTYPAQKPMYHYVKGNPQSVEDSDITAQLVDPRFSEMMEGLSTDLGAVEAVKKAIARLNRGSDLWIVTPHAGDLIDVAFGMKIGRNLLAQEGFIPDLSIFNLSKALGWGQYDMPGVGDIPMIPVVQTLSDRLLLPWPKTNSSEEALSILPKSEVNRHNRQVREYTEELLDEGAVVGALAPTGTTRIATDSPDTYEISPISGGAIEMMTHPNTYVLPMPMWREGNEFAVRVHDPVEVRKPAQAHAVMRSMSETLNEIVKGKTFNYGTAPS